MSNVKYFFPENMIETQRHFMDMYFDMAQRNLNKEENDEKSSAANEPSHDINDFVKRMLKASENYFDMAELFLGSSKDKSSAEHILKNWSDQMSVVFKDMMNPAFPEFKDMSKNPSAFWDMPQDTMNRAMSTLFPFPGDFFRAFRPEGLSRMPGDIHGHLDHFLATPSIGYTRESQDKYKKLSRLMLEYYKTLNEYNAAMGKVSLEALTAFQHEATKLIHTQQEEPISFKDIYNLWTKTAEEIYGKYVLTEEYTKLYGTLVNNMMAVKQQTAKIVDEMFEALNLPTRKEMNTLNKRVQEVRRNFDFNISEDIENLKERIAELEAQLGKPTSKKAAAKKAVKKTVKKKSVRKAKTTSTAKKVAKKKPAAKKASTKKAAAKKTVTARKKTKTVKTTRKRKTSR